jgi:hypothetical protein
MVFNASRISRRALGMACTAAALVAISPAGATATSQKILGVTIPASARVKGTTPTSTTAPAPTTTSTSAGGAQPGTVAPATTTPATTTSATTKASTTPASATPTSVKPTTTVVVVHKTNHKSTRLSTGALALAVLGALLALGAIVWALARWLALEPRWTVSLVYSLREASYRASATWAEFSDWVRLGH